MIIFFSFPISHFPFFFFTTLVHIHMQIISYYITTDDAKMQPSFLFIITKMPDIKQEIKYVPVPFLGSNSYYSLIFIHIQKQQQKISWNRINLTHWILLPPSYCLFQIERLHIIVPSLWTLFFNTFLKRNLLWLF